MTETLLLDYAFSRPTVEQIKSVGAVGVMRYLTRNTGDLKVLGRGEAYALRAADLQVGVVFEDYASRALLGAAAGRADAEFATAQALAIGVPTSCPIFYAVDVDTTPESVFPYFMGALSAHTYPVGVYGGIDVVDGLMRNRAVPWGWQTGAWSNDSNGHPRVSTLAHLYQRIVPTKPVSGCDENVLLRPFPLWGSYPTDLPPTGAPGGLVGPATPVLEDDMAKLYVLPDLKTVFVANALMKARVLNPDQQALLRQCGMVLDQDPIKLVTGSPDDRLLRSLPWAPLVAA